MVGCCIGYRTTAGVRDWILGCNGESTTLLDEPEILHDRPATGRRGRAFQARPNHVSRTGHASTAELPGTLLYGRTANAGWASKPTWGHSQEAYDAPRGACCPRQGFGGSCKTPDNPGEDYDLHRCPGCHRTHGLGGTWAPANVCDTG